MASLIFNEVIPSDFCPYLDFDLAAGQVGAVGGSPHCRFVFFLLAPCGRCGTSKCRHDDNSGDHKIGYQTRPNFDPMDLILRLLFLQVRKFEILAQICNVAAEIESVIVLGLPQCGNIHL